MLYNREDSFMYSLMNDKLSTCYNYYIQNEIEWQNVDELNSSEVGMNQVNELNEEDAYTFTFTREGDCLANDELDKIMSSTKTKIDYLDTSYMYGINKYGDISVRLPASKVNNQTLTFIDKYNFLSLRCGPRVITISYDILDIADDSKSLYLYLSKDTLNYFNSMVSKSNTQRVYLLFNNEPIMYTDLKGNDYSKLTFDTFCYKDDNEGEDWFINYVYEMYNSNSNIDINDYYTGYYVLTNIIYGHDGYGDKSHYGIKESYLLDLQGLKEHLLDSFDCIDVKIFNSHLDITFTQNMKPDELVDSMEAIYKCVNDNSEYPCSIYFELGHNEKILIYHQNCNTHLLNQE